MLVSGRSPHSIDITLGYFKSKFFSLGGGFWVFDTQDNQVAEIKGDWKGWKGWNFKFIGNIPSNNSHINSLLLAAGLAIDIIYKEKG